MRKKYLIPLLAALFVSACNSGEKGAQALLRRAEAAYEEIGRASCRERV